MTYKVQHKDGPGAKWRDMRFGINAFATEAEAWERVASFDQDGVVDRVWYRVVPR